MPLELSGSIVISGSMTVSGSIGYTGSLQSTGDSTTDVTGSLFGTSSWALNAISASWAPCTCDPAIFAVSSSGSTIYSANPATYTFSTTNSVFLGASAGYLATNAQYSSFVGYSAGAIATNASHSVFLGQSAGAYAAEAENSVMIGTNAGYLAPSASYGVLLGYRAGYDATNTSSSIGPNNIILGTSVTLEKDRRDSINLGGVIFATGSYFSTVGSAFSGSMPNAKVGINKSLPQYTLDVSGNGNFETDLIVSGTLAVGDNIVVPITINIDPAPLTGSMYLKPGVNELWIYTGNSATGWVTASLGI